MEELEDGVCDWGGVAEGREGDSVAVGIAAARLVGRWGCLDSRAVTS